MVYKCRYNRFNDLQILFVVATVYSRRIWFVGRRRFVVGILDVHVDDDPTDICHSHQRWSTIGPWSNGVTTDLRSCSMLVVVKWGPRWFWLWSCRSFVFLSLRSPIVPLFLLYLLVSFTSYFVAGIAGQSYSNFIYQNNSSKMSSDRNLFAKKRSKNIFAFYGRVRWTNLLFFLLKILFSLVE